MRRSEASVGVTDLLQLAFDSCWAIKRRPVAYGVWCRLLAHFSDMGAWLT